LAASVASFAVPAVAATQTVSIRDNSFTPEEVHVDPGDSVIWSFANGRNRHRVQSDERGQFDSGEMTSGDTFTHAFDKEGYYFYYCRYHGAPRGVGMSGVVIVGNPPPPDTGGGEKDERPKLVVPDDFPTIQKAVDAAKPGSTVLIKPGTYREAVTVQTPRLVIKGVDRFRTILNGDDEKGSGITVDGANDVKVTNLTVRNYAGNGVYFVNMNGYTATKIDSIKNRTYGIYAFNSYDGVIKNSWSYGSGDGAYYIGQCLGCSGLIEHVVGTWSYLGYSGTNATGVVIRDSVFTHNAVGVAPNTLPTEELGPNRGTVVINNKIFDNNYDSIPAAGFSANPVGIPIGVGVWLPGVENNVVMYNDIRDHNSYGVLVSQSVDSDLPVNNQVMYNVIRNSDFDEDGYGYDLAWDGTGESNCFSFNDFEGDTGPPDIETLYACASRPFPGAPYPPVQAHLAENVPNSQTRPQEEPPEPTRPSCQKGAPGCNRH
jgi:plastocyanin